MKTTKQPKRIFASGIWAVALAKARGERHFIKKIFSCHGFATSAAGNSSQLRRMASRKHSAAERLLTVALLALWGAGRSAQNASARIPQRAPGQVSPNTCPVRAPGSTVTEPEDLRSVGGEFSVDLTLHNYKEEDGSTRYCYTTPDGKESPNLRLNPGDLLILNLKNDLIDPGGVAPAVNHQLHTGGKKKTDPCVSGLMTATSTNLHFHGLTLPSICHQDEVLNTSIQPQDTPFQYRFRIPANEPPGLYWYHPHIHGFSKSQVLGGASGAIVVEGIERAVKAVAGLPERVLVIRDRDLVNPDAPPSKSEPVLPPMLIDRDGDAVNNGTGFGKPAKDLSINFIPIIVAGLPSCRVGNETRRAPTVARVKRFGYHLPQPRSVV